MKSGAQYAYIGCRGGPCTHTRTYNQTYQLDILVTALHQYHITCSFCRLSITSAVVHALPVMCFITCGLMSLPHCLSVTVGTEVWVAFGFPIDPWECEVSPIFSAAVKTTRHRAAGHFLRFLQGFCFCVAGMFKTKSSLLFFCVYVCGPLSCFDV